MDSQPSASGQGSDSTYEYVDTHTHFLDGARADIDPVIRRALHAGVTRMLVPSIDLANCETVLAIADAYPQVFAAVGIHPNGASSDDDFNELERLAMRPRVRAIGETGLDYYRQHTDPALQRAHLEKHMRLAGATRLPIVLHNRDADDDIYGIAAAFRSSVQGVLHCFSGSTELARKFLELGYYISFAGNLTYPTAAELREVAAAIPIDRLLVETDSPYLAPAPLRGRTNEPANVVYTAAVLAAARGARVSDIAPSLVANSRRLFGL